jgi:hypothetical protein
MNPLFILSILYIYANTLASAVPIPNARADGIIQARANKGGILQSWIDSLSNFGTGTTFEGKKSSKHSKVTAKPKNDDDTEVVSAEGAKQDGADMDCEEEDVTGEADISEGGGKSGRTTRKGTSTTSAPSSSETGDSSSVDPGTSEE